MSEIKEMVANETVENNETTPVVEKPKKDYIGMAKKAGKTALVFFLGYGLGKFSVKLGGNNHAGISSDVSVASAQTDSE